MTEYVAGFLFDAGMHNVALIRKNRPAWQRGHLNAIGGHVEPGEDAISAMEREFREETGSTTRYAWRLFNTLSGQDWRVHFYVAQGDTTRLHTATDELVTPCHVEPLPESVIPNLRWLVPMAINVLKGAESPNFWTEVRA